MSEDYTANVSFTVGPAGVVTALTTLDGLAGWWTEASGDGHQGGELAFTFADPEPVRMRVDLVRPDLVQWTCLGYRKVPDWGGTVLHFALTARADGGCELAFRHEGLTPAVECFEDCRNGWNHFMPSLRSYVETGIGSPRGSAADADRRAARAADKVAAS